MNSLLKKLTLMTMLFFLLTDLYAVSLNNVICPVRHSTSQTNNIINEKFYLSDMLTHSVFKIRKFDKKYEEWSNLGTATLIYKSTKNTAYFVTAEHVFEDKNYDVNSEDSKYQYYLYAPGMTDEEREGQILIPRENISYWGNYRYGNTRYCDSQGGNQTGDLEICNQGLDEGAEGIDNPDIAIFKVEDFTWGSKPIDIDFKFNDVDLDGDFHLLGYRKEINSPILVNNISPKQNFGNHYSSSYIHDGQSGSLLVSDFGVGYAVQSKYTSSTGNDAEKIVVTPFSEVMSFLHDKFFYELSIAECKEQPTTECKEEPTRKEAREKSIDQFIKKILVDEKSVTTPCRPTDSDCQRVDYRKINLLLRQDWQHALHISIIIAREVLETTASIAERPVISSKSSLNQDIDNMVLAVEGCKCKCKCPLHSETSSSSNDCPSLNSCSQHPGSETSSSSNDCPSLNSCSQHPGFKKLKNRLLALGANAHNRRALAQMLECTLGREKADIYAEYSRILNTLYTALGTYISSNDPSQRNLTSFIKVSNHNNLHTVSPQSSLHRAAASPRGSLLTSIIRRQKEDLSAAVNTLIEKRQNTAGQEHVFRNVQEIKEISNTAIELDDLVKSTCNFFNKQFRSAINFLAQKPEPQPIRLSDGTKRGGPIRLSDGTKRGAEKRLEDFLASYQHAKSYKEKVNTCYKEAYGPWLRERQDTVKSMCREAKKSGDYYEKLEDYERKAINDCYTANPQPAPIIIN